MSHVPYVGECLDCGRQVRIELPGNLAARDSRGGKRVRSACCEAIAYCQKPDDGDVNSALISEAGGVVR